MRAVFVGIISATSWGLVLVPTEGTSFVKEIDDFEKIKVAVKGVCNNNNNNHE